MGPHQGVSQAHFCPRGPWPCGVGVPFAHEGLEAQGARGLLGAGRAWSLGLWGAAGWCWALGAVAALTPTPTPPADCLLMLAYKDKSERAKGLRERSSLTLEDICGLEPGLPYEGLAHTLAIVCLSQAVMLGFDSREAMCAWDARIRYALGEGECAQSPRGRVLPALRGPRGSHRWAAEAGSRLPVPAERPLVSRDWGDGGFTGEMPLELPNLATSI